MAKQKTNKSLEANAMAYNVEPFFFVCNFVRNGILGP